jgi:hypothetical protein
LTDAEVAGSPGDDQITGAFGRRQCSLILCQYRRNQLCAEPHVKSVANQPGATAANPAGSGGVLVLTHTQQGHPQFKHKKRVKINP